MTRTKFWKTTITFEVLTAHPESPLPDDMTLQDIVDLSTADFVTKQHRTRDWDHLLGKVRGLARTTRADQALYPRPLAPDCMPEIHKTALFLINNQRWITGYIDAVSDGFGRQAPSHVTLDGKPDQEYLFSDINAWAPLPAVPEQP
jgi:hypothetical protein